MCKRLIKQTQDMQIKLDFNPIGTLQMLKMFKLINFFDVFTHFEIHVNVQKMVEHFTGELKKVKGASLKGSVIHKQWSKVHKNCVGK